MVPEICEKYTDDGDRLAVSSARGGGQKGRTGSPRGKAMELYGQIPKSSKSVLKVTPKLPVSVPLTS